MLPGLPSEVPAALPGRFRPQYFRDFRVKNRRDIGKSQSMWAGPKMKTAGSHLWHRDQPPLARILARELHGVVGDLHVV